MPIIADISEALLELGLETTCSEAERALAQACLVKATGAVIRHLNYDPVKATRIEFYPQADASRSGRESIWESNDTQAYERFVSQASTDELQLKHLPIRSITSLKIDYDGRFGTRVGSFGASTAKTEGTDFWPVYDGLDSDGVKFCRDGILRSMGLWPDVAGSVKVEYVAGYNIDELHGQDTIIDASPIVEAVLDETTRRFLKIKSRMKKRLSGFAGPLSSEGLGDYNYAVQAGILDKLIGVGNDILNETALKLQDFVRCDYGVM